MKNIYQLAKSCTCLLRIKNNTFFPQFKYEYSTTAFKGLTYKSFYTKKVSKKEQMSSQKKKQKQNIKQSLGDTTVVDLTKFEQAYEKSIVFYKQQVIKIKSGQLDPAAFEDTMAKVGKQSVPISQLAQISQKNATVIVISPFDSDSIDAIDKAVRASNESFDTKRNQKSLIVTLQNLSITQMKKKSVQKLKMLANDRQQDLKKIRQKNNEDLKKYKKVVPQDRFKKMEKQLKEIHDKKSQQVTKITKNRQKQLMK